MIADPAPCAHDDPVCDLRSSCCSRVCLIVSLLFYSVTTLGIAAESAEDIFHYIDRINRASVVMEVEEGKVSAELGAKITAAIFQGAQTANNPEASDDVRPQNYMPIEALLIKAGGPEVSSLHAGRSRVDVNATKLRLAHLDVTLEAYDAFLSARESMLDFAESEPGALIPIYTMGRMAAPTTLAHYLGGYLQALSRVSASYQEAWLRLNFSQLGSTVGTTTTFPMNRPRLAELLGFDGLLENSFDAVHVAHKDVIIELSGISSSAASIIRASLADIMWRRYFRINTAVTTRSNLMQIPAVDSPARQTLRERGASPGGCCRS